jgi:putative membrane protein
MPGMDGGGLSSGLITVLLLATAAGYLAGASRCADWPWWRTAAWCAGLGTAGAGVALPAHDFRAHMVTHLLLGMAAPLLLVLAAPVTVTLRTLPVVAARRLSRVLRAWPVRVVAHPAVAAALDAGGVWALLRTGLYAEMGRHSWLSVLVHFHLLAAGYLFTAAVVGVDPAPHRPGRRVRAAALLALLAAHDILAKQLYARPPAGVPVAAAQPAAELMYYGGAAIDLALVVVFCHQWYAATDPRRRTRALRPARPPRPWRLPAEMRRPLPARHDPG